MTTGPPKVPRPTRPERAASARVEALTAAVRDGRDRAEQEFWAEVAEHGGPLVEPIPGDPGHLAVTFLWRGTDRTRQALALVNRMVDPLDPSDGLMRRVPGTRVWHVTYRMEPDHSGSYRIAAGTGEDSAPDALKRLSAQAVHDPFNPRTIPLRWGEGRASVFELPDAPAPPWRPWDTPAAVPAHRGTVTRERVPSTALGEDREVWVYAPPVQDGPFDTLVLLDGDMWFGRFGVHELLDRLIADGAVPPLAVLAPHAVADPTRTRDLSCDRAHTEFIASELMEWAAGRLTLTGDPARTVIAGEGLGGLTALHVGLEAPGRFGQVLAQSASLRWHPDGDLDADPWLTARYAEAPRRDLRIHLRVGRHEWAVVGEHRALYRTLRAKGYPVTHTEYNGGHDYVCWTDGLAAGLTGLLGT